MFVNTFGNYVSNSSSSSFIIALPKDIVLCVDSLIEVAKGEEQELSEYSGYLALLWDIEKAPKYLYRDQFVYPQTLVDVKLGIFSTSMVYNLIHNPSEKEKHFIEQNADKEFFFVTFHDWDTEGVEAVNRRYSKILEEFPHIVYSAWGREPERIVS